MRDSTIPENGMAMKAVPFVFFEAYAFFMPFALPISSKQTLML